MKSGLRDFLRDFCVDWNREKEWNRSARMRGYTRGSKAPPPWLLRVRRALGAALKGRRD